MNEKLYKHYGSTHLNSDIKYPNAEYYVSNIGRHEIKPIGLWGCTEDSFTSNWYHWCKKESYKVNRLKSWFTFQLNDNANILKINNIDIFVRNPELLTNFDGMLDGFYRLNLEYITSHYDGIELCIDESSCPDIYDENFVINRYLLLTAYPMIGIREDILGQHMKNAFHKIQEYYSDDEYEKLKRCFGLFTLWDVESLCVWNLNVIDEASSSDQKSD